MSKRNKPKYSIKPVQEIRKAWVQSQSYTVQLDATMFAIVQRISRDKKFATQVFELFKKSFKK